MNVHLIVSLIQDVIGLGVVVFFRISMSTYTISLQQSRFRNMDDKTVFSRLIFQIFPNGLSLIIQQFPYILSTPEKYSSR